MANGFVTAPITVSDPTGALFLVRGWQSGNDVRAPSRDRNEVIERPSNRTAKSWYHSEVFAAASGLRRSASKSIQTSVEGVG